jgi:hypothetical protein
MPKEVVRYANEFVVRDGRVVYNPDSKGPDEVVKHTEEIALHWTKGDAGMVQLSIQLDAEQVRQCLAAYDTGQWLGEELKPGMLMFYSGNLERYELQRLIRHARRARDDVHGVDE